LEAVAAATSFGQTRIDVVTSFQDAPVSAARDVEEVDHQAVRSLVPTTEKLQPGVD